MKSEKILAALVTVVLGSAGGLGATSAYEGDSVLKATVKDAESGEPLIGAAILIEGTSTGVVTDLDGKCELLLGDGDYSLLVSYVGFFNLYLKVSVSGRSVNVMSVSDDGSQGNVHGGSDAGGHVPSDGYMTLLPGQATGHLFRQSL